MTRRQTLAGFAATVATTSFGAVAAVRHAAAAGGASAPVILGKGEYRYRVVENWGELPPGYTSMPIRFTHLTLTDPMIFSPHARDRDRRVSYPAAA